LDVAVKVTDGVTVNAVVTLLVPSLTTIELAPPGRFGTETEVWKLPVAVVVRQPPTTKLLADPLPPFANEPNGEAQATTVYQGTVVEPTVVVIEIGLAGRKPLPPTTMVVPTVADVAAVSTPLEIVDVVTVALAA